MKINFSQNGSNQATQWAQKKQDMLEKAAKIKAERKSTLANTGERAMKSQIGKLFELSRDNNQHQNVQEQYHDQHKDQYHDQYKDQYKDQYNDQYKEPQQHYSSYQNPKPQMKQKNEWNFDLPQPQSNEFKPSYNTNIQNAAMDHQDYYNNKPLNNNKPLQNKNANQINSQTQMNQQYNYQQDYQQSQQAPQIRGYDNQYVGQQSQNQYQNQSYQQQNEYQKPVQKPVQKQFGNQPSAQLKVSKFTVEDQQLFQTSNKDSNNQQRQRTSELQTNKQIQPQQRRLKPANQVVQSKIVQSNYIDPQDDRPLNNNNNVNYDYDAQVENQINDQVGPLVDCPKGCGRSFAQTALKIHAKICVKVFQKKRKEFNSQKHRMDNSDQAEYVNQMSKNEKKYQIKTKKKNWKNESLAFRAQMKANRGGQISQAEKIASAQVSQQSLIQCKFCGRKFNEVSAQQHIPYCQKKALDNQYRTKPQKR